MYNELLSESIVREELKTYATKFIRELNHPNILSVGNLNRSNNSIIVKIKDSESISDIMEKLHSGFGTNEEIMTNKKSMGRYSDVLEIFYRSKVGKINIIVRPKMNNRNGVILEELIAFLLSMKVTSKLLDRLDLPEDSSTKDVIDAAIKDHRNIYDIAKFAKNLIKNKIPDIKKVETVGSLQNKADIVLTDEDGNKYGISVKMSLDKNIRFEYNKNLGYGNESNTLVPSPNNKPWWLIGRKLFYSNLKKSGKVKQAYNPTEKDIKAPRWLVKAKDQYPEIYKKTIVALYDDIRSVFFKKLRKMKVEKLASMINDSRMGGEEERNSYKAFYKLTYDKKGVTLEKVGKGKTDLTGLTPSKVVKKKGSNIIIEIPGMEPLVINSVKFQSNMLSSNKEYLKLKTR